MTLKQLNKQLEKEYQNLIQKGMDWAIENDENESVYFLKNAYNFVFYQAVVYFFSTMNNNEFNKEWRNHFESNPCTNVLEELLNYWLTCDQTKYNFMTTYGLSTIILKWFLSK